MRLNNADAYAYRESMKEAIDNARTYADGDESIYTWPLADDDPDLLLLTIDGFSLTNGH